MPMLDETLGRLEAAKLRWMTGGVAEAGDDSFTKGTDSAETQLRLLAQAALFRQSCLRPEPPGDLTEMQPLPAPTLPLLPEPLRPAFRQMMQQQDRSVWQGLMGLMVARGVMAHPFDWLPPQDMSGYPDAYIPLAKWKAGLSDNTVALTADTWDDMYSAERRKAFADLRASDPTAARELMQDHGGGLPAEDRLGLVDGFAIGLSMDDAEYLTALTQHDRSSKVKARAQGLLARLGVVADGGDAQELADFMEKSTTGLIRRRNVIKLRGKLNEAQKKRANSLFENVSFARLASALAVTPDTLAAGYVTEPRPMMSPFLQMCIRTAPNDALLIYWDRLRADGVAQFAMLADMAQRLSKDQVLAEARALLRANSLTDLRDMLAVTGPDVGPTLSDALLAAPFYANKLKDVKAALAKRAKGEGDYQGSHTISQFENFITLLAFLITASHATRVMADLEALGFHSADPVLRPLKFNIALQGPTP
ncbi:DUF5691 domain-containing protein [Yoonia sp. SDW83-1]|uniref:DUF5691 domain-containing protein n=1 Tax=Yoonia sp. SDW83-1 TaxID=3366945 RepID=UPI00398C52CB